MKLHSAAGVGMARVARFILDQKDIPDSVPFLINHDNVLFFSGKRPVHGWALCFKEEA
ncbi:hypothetical protein K3G63_13475 [Hymenobacter sp. HSC-4F20]|uniref:hypothetical protein n=1 Tax=Hymenobacter sp. HSC-4F20 TaxID=2864135 RepID=UPI001C72FFA9|nr:hypothetical protein [Hymenobacter sp. HSC-4F20]MBX0291455.1 hypothetical protein [Hymenobacter sp. HSC-4F20]